ncbi:hypothetical protein SNEBB_001918 [Seison nebaliae]|nr:hypothetical protein SNEBB_001918 [Seison nebaliae]
MTSERRDLKAFAPIKYEERKVLSPIQLNRLSPITKAKELNKDQPKVVTQTSTKEDAVDKEINLITSSEESVEYWKRMADENNNSLNTCIQENDKLYELIEEQTNEIKKLESRMDDNKHSNRKVLSPLLTRITPKRKGSLSNHHLNKRLFQNEKKLKTNEGDDGNFYKTVAEETRQALEVSLRENEELHQVVELQGEKLDDLEAELEEADNLLENCIVQYMEEKLKQEETNYPELIEIE